MVRRDRGRDGIRRGADQTLSAHTKREGEKGVTPSFFGADVTIEGVTPNATRTPEPRTPPILEPAADYCFGPTGGPSPTMK